MTPTEQDKELRELVEVLDGPYGYEADLERLIEADRKRVALEARIDENEAWYALGRMIDPREFVIEIGRLELKKQELEKL